MKHARADYARIQDPAGLIPEDEPVFLLRGQDQAAAVAVKIWANVAENLGADPRIVRAARSQADAMIEWQTKCAQKVPDLLPAGITIEMQEGGINSFEMTDQDLRLECLKLATKNVGTESTAAIHSRANQFFDYVKKGQTP